MEALATTSELAERLPFVMSADDEREAQGVLEDLSDDVRLLGRASWTTQANTPRQICRLVLRAAVRHMRNPDGYTQSRAGDESVSWTDRGEQAGSAYFTDNERETIRTIAGKSSVYSVGTFAHSDRSYRRTHEGLVPDGDTGTMLHYFSLDEDPW